MEMTQRFVLVVILLATGAASAAVRRVDQGVPLKEKMPWYHSTEELKQEISDISAGCSGQMEITTKTKINSGTSAGTEVAIDVVTVRKTGTAPRTKAMFVFGEHARELISPESGLDLLRTLCGQGSGGHRASSLLEKVEFTIVPNANPLGRKKVEEGFYCKRTNEDNVDLNRNWGDDHRPPAMEFAGDEMDPGPNGFSEPETQILRDLAEELHPDVYLSIHSGAYLLGAPFGYTANKIPADEQNQVDLLQSISEKYCGGNCPYGGLADLIGYNSMGCDVDYMAEHVKTPFSYTWEIFVGPAIRKHYIAEAMHRSGKGDLADDDDEFLQKGRSLEHQTGGLRGKHALHRVQRASELKQSLERPESEQDWNDCIEQFNPRTASETSAVVENWTGAYLDLAESVDGKRHK